MVIFDRSDSNISGNIMVTLLKAQEGGTYDYCSKKSPKMLERNCKILIWNKRIIE